MLALLLLCLVVYACAMRVKEKRSKRSAPVPQSSSPRAGRRAKAPHIAVGSWVDSHDTHADAAAASLFVHFPSPGREDEEDAAKSGGPVRVPARVDSRDVGAPAASHPVTGGRFPGQAARRHDTISGAAAPTAPAGYPGHSISPPTPQLWQSPSASSSDGVAPRVAPAVAPQHPWGGGSAATPPPVYRTNDSHMIAGGGYAGPPGYAARRKSMADLAAVTRAAAGAAVTTQRVSSTLQRAWGSRKVMADAGGPPPGVGAIRRPSSLSVVASALVAERPDQLGATLQQPPHEPPRRRSSLSAVAAALTAEQQWQQLRQQPQQYL